MTRPAAEDVCPQAAEPTKVCGLSRHVDSQNMTVCPVPLGGNHGTAPSGGHWMEQDRETRPPKRFRSGGGDGLAEGSPVAVVKPPLPVPSGVAVGPIWQLVEIFCGIALLSKACIDEGISAIGIDQCYARRPRNAPWIAVDVTVDEMQEVVFKMFSEPESHSIPWIALPCGTLTRARERPMPEAWRKAGVPDAPPLRSVHHLWGLDEMLSDPLHGPRIRAANKLIKFMFMLITMCEELGLPWFVENPMNSLLWFFLDWLNIDFVDVEFSACAHGGAREKWQRIRASRKHDWLQPLRASCPGGHKHLPWGPKFVAGAFAGFNSGDEACYPLIFCRKTAKLIATKLKSWPLPSKPVSSIPTCSVSVAAKIHRIDENKAKVAKIAAVAGWQSRGRAMDQVVPEHKELWMITAPIDASSGLVRRMRYKKKTMLGDTEVPVETQVLSWVTEGVFDIKVQLGIPWTPTEFFGQARKVIHPFAASAADEDVAFAVFNVLTKGPKATASHREEFFSRWEARAKELEYDEQMLCSGLHPDIQKQA